MPSDRGTGETVALSGLTIVRRSRKHRPDGKSIGLQGQALIEFALMVPLLFLLIVLAIDFGGFIYSWIGVADAARAAANYEILGGASLGLPRTATATQLRSLITADLASLPNTSASNPSVSICQNDNGSVTTISGTCSGSTLPPADPEAPSYISVSVDITYTYAPLIPAFAFPRLGINLPTIPTTVRRRTVMRLMQ